MKEKYYLICICSMLFGCVQKLEDFNIIKAPSQIVIEGFVTNLNTNHRVRITRTGDYYNQTSTEIVENAIVAISNLDTKFTDTLSYSKNGYYFSKKWAGIAGNNYLLSVFVDGKNYEGTDKMPSTSSFKLDTMYSHFTEIANRFNSYGQGDFADIAYISSGDSLYEVKTKGFFNSKSDGFVRGELFRNQYQYKNPNIFFILPLALIKNKSIEVPVPDSFIKEDTIKLNILDISEQTYKFYEALWQLNNYEGGLFSPPPGNPPGNIKNALGLFEASYVKVNSLLIK